MNDNSQLSQFVGPLVIIYFINGGALKARIINFDQYGIAVEREENRHKNEGLSFTYTSTFIPHTAIKFITQE